MATAYTADDYSTPNPSGVAGQLLVRPFKFTVSTALVVNDTIKLVQLAMQNAPGFMLSAIRIDIPDLDSGSGLVFQLGDSTAADRFVTTTLAGAIGQTAGVLSSFGPSIAYAASTAAGGVVAGSLPVSYTAQDNLILKVQTGPSTGLTGVAIKGQIWYAQMGLASL